MRIIRFFPTKRSPSMIEKMHSKQRFARLQLMSRLLVAFLLLLSLLSAQPALKRVSSASIPQHAKPLVILDAGHGGSDDGAKVGHFMEKKLTLSTVMLLKKYLTEMGYRVILT